MSIISLLYGIVLDALFPLSVVEETILSSSPEEAYRQLPPAPGYEGLAIDLPWTKSLFSYKDERVAKLVWNIKYKKSPQAIKVGGYALWRELVSTTTEQMGFSLPLVVIPIPITKKRRRERGYNQCELLADEIERLDDSSQFQIERNLLVRIHHASRQTLKGRKDRVESARGIFAVNKKAIAKLRIQMLKNLKSKNSHGQFMNNEQDNEIPLKNIPLIIIDDVITTGSTMFEAMETLKKAGFDDVHGLSLAH
ncbi:MAG: hypothetical protein A3C79_02625 [Candidatus Taylorbacteria bacterium RIFCSPHIGHO2_02_FULL_45_28]|uniref:Phosphoribosyltransferase domain-containing protein n=1 Tax=Candidatus Taylorbacteria bacterium RIFCSPHIGHO2_12_FULL_45_16 TaxID=1802315 RepID=A0A1G2N0K9_9BACT|nr:MAG: hypothetical protein A2830_03430 [Candidatus Taylorbacteria bacterium RIFCSPHIGHO2_01_FULL_44_110]OHA25344.1 MAG: hypothetical protein A3C79_02625 [Candidatus Taylorbacteria bacterium RIFCSPHIGHO2_02_FULL_45_28]OHA28731.1 MAG: hypothetical protein A3F51_03090 [Candidatus Taylorbacteria bacterium RIFCSPHIGHO2_12_FULL_45_16]OHA33004.1 MAG: hypothetical protein A3A23_01270 [Candidatus Taylorbacteria bacterium RIFCSPLOWO2_01_FULL_45_59]OHA39673.1 MAG: hypothetical protein A3I98_00990 [Candi